MNAREVARGIAIVGNVLLAGSVLLVLVWLPLSLKLFVAACVLYGVAWLIERAVANQTFEMAPSVWPPVQK